MLNQLTGINRTVKVNDINYNSVEELLQELQTQKFKGDVQILIEPSEVVVSNTATKDTIYKIKVRQYMTRPSTPEFNFHEKWNNNIPMPMRVMVGRKLEETKGMVKMELWGQITDEVAEMCMKCGRRLTNNVSKYFGIGPECGGHNYIHPFETEQELKDAVKQQNEQLMKIKWTGWIVKSAIEEETIIE